MTGPRGSLPAPWRAASGSQARRAVACDCGRRTVAPGQVRWETGLAHVALPPSLATWPERAVSRSCARQLREQDDVEADSRYATPLRAAASRARSRSPAPPSATWRNRHCAAGRSGPGPRASRPALGCSRPPTGVGPGCRRARVLDAVGRARSAAGDRRRSSHARPPSSAGQGDGAHRHRLPCRDGDRRPVASAAELRGQRPRRGQPGASSQPPASWAARSASSLLRRRRRGRCDLAACFSAPGRCTGQRLRAPATRCGAG